MDRSEAQLKRVSCFKYLGSVVFEKGRCGEGVRERVKVAWNKWRAMSSTRCYKRMPIELKVKVYKKKQL